MKASKFSEAQKAFILKQGADGVPVAEISLLSLTQDEGDLRLRELRLLHAENSIRSPCC